MSSNFNFYVNRQGVQGKRGAKGEQGFSPVISVESQTANEYILKVENEDGSFTTPNLRGNAIENSGGTYIRFNPETEQMYTGFADSATTEQAGVVRMGTYDDLVAGESEELVPNVADVHNFVQNSIGDISGFVTTSDFNAYTTATDTAIGALDTNKLDFTDLINTLVQGSNITLTTDAVNKKITISSSGGGGGTQVQADWTETDSADPSFIQNKPTLGTMAAEDASDYTPSAGLSEVAISGSYNDLLNKPTLFSGDYDDLTNKPTIPAAANDATITITQGGVTKGSFTTNQSTNATIDIDAGGGSSLVGGNGIDINASDEIDIMQADNIVPATYNWDFNTVGTLTEVDGVYSGFSGFSNYLKSKTAFSVDIATSLDIKIEFTTGTNLRWQNLLNTGFSQSMVVEFYSSQMNIDYYTSSTSSDSRISLRNLSIQPNTTYTLLINYSSGELSASLAASGAAPVTATKSGVSGIYLGSNNRYFCIGLKRNSDYADFGGSINTNNSYIKIDGNFLDMTENPSQSKYCAKATSSLYGLVKPDGSTTQVTNGVISTVNTVQSSTVKTIVQITQTDYDALTTKDANTLYVIIPASS